ncbi:MAG TPA: HEAT repeat domain-containing protein [Chryseolinea sp.]|nr:HEAT repeat domain-containing protein [Chryseolinea sp.]
MEVERIQELIAKYNAMTADPAELREIEHMIENGILDISDLVELRAMEEGVEHLETPMPSLALDHKFHAMLQAEKKTPRSSSFSWKVLFTWEGLAPKLALASVTLIAGLIGGMYLQNPGHKDLQIQQLGDEVRELKELTMLSMLEKESATERLKAVSLTQDMDQASRAVTNALLQTLNNDENLNVRLAALDALRPYSQQSEVREALIRSISKQDSPLVQVALAELMAALQAKSSVKELQKIMRDKTMPSEVKKKIQESIEVLS